MLGMVLGKETTYDTKSNATATSTDGHTPAITPICLFYTSDAADQLQGRSFVTASI